MPRANSSQIHPHLQLIAGYFPLRIMRTYYKHYGNIIVKMEQIIGLTSLLKRKDFRKGILQRSAILSGLLALFPRKDVESFCQGLTKIFKYIDDQNSYSFNLCLYSGIIEEDSFWTQARIIRRGTLPTMGISDIGSMQLLLDTKPSWKYPENVCQELKAYFA